MDNINLWSFIILISYYIIFAGSISLLDYLTSYKREWIRKGYHLLYSFSLIIYFYLFSSWYTSIIAIITITLLGTLILKIAEKSPALMKLSISRSSALGEVIRQMNYAHSLFIVLLFIFRFLWPEYHYHALTGVIIWGFGDAAAALAGKKYGKNHFYNSIFAEAKTIEGTMAFVFFSLLPAFLVLYFLGNFNFGLALLIALILCISAALLEALSRKGLDTLTVPLSTSLILLLLDILIL